MKITKIIFLRLLLVGFMAQNLNALVASSACSSAVNGGNSVFQIFMNVLTSSYNALPIRIAGIPIVPNISGADDYSSAGNPVCVCMTPFPRVGITFEYWEPLAIIEASAIPNCSPTIGTHLPIDVVAGGSFQEINKQNAQNKESYQVNYIKYPIFKMLSMFIDLVCMEGDAELDYLYLSTIDPLWQNDMWSAIIHPEVFLFANPIANLACMADAVKANTGFSIDAMFWCMGSWNQTYPLTKATTGVTSPESAMAIASKTLFKLHRQMMLWGTVGSSALCSKYLMPVMRKSQYAMFPVYPIMTHPRRIPIGRSGMIWGIGQDAPVVNTHNWAIMIYRKRDCCAL